MSKQKRTLLKESKKFNGEQKRSNLWVCVVYPDSLPDNFYQIIANWHIPCALSPLHNKDKNGDETEKKKHYHLMIDFGSGQNKSFNQVLQFTEQLNGTIPIICHNRQAMLRYFIHLDNPNKSPYDKKDIQFFSGFEIMNAFDSYTNDSLIYDRLESIIYDNMIFNYAHLVQYLRKHNYLYELDFLRRHSNHINYILNGYFQLISKNSEKILHL